MKGIFMEKSRMKDAEKKSNGTNMFFAHKFIASSEMM
jgi:hypothetical protein